jgi:hypothetical protein
MGPVSEALAIAPSDMGGKRGLCPPPVLEGEVVTEEQVAGLSARLQVNLAAAMLNDPARFGDAVNLLTDIMRTAKSMRARAKAADLLLRHAHRIVALGMPKPAVELHTTGPTTIIFKSMLGAGVEEEPQ